MFSTALLPLVLAAPVEVFEEYSLAQTQPLTEVVTVRAVYSRRDGDTALLPATLTRASRPVVYALGDAHALAVTWSPRGWQCALPAGSAERVRLVARVSRAIPLPTMFHTAWPAVVPLSAPARRVVTVPRAWLDATPVGWTCPDEPDDEVPCVSHERAPGPVLSRLPSPPSPRGSALLSVALTALALTVVAWSPRRRAERVVAALGGIAVGLAVCLALVGAYVSSWGTAASQVLPLAALLGSVAPRTRYGRIVGAASLVVLPVAAMASVPATAVLTLALLLGAVVLGASMLPHDDGRGT